MTAFTATTGHTFPPVKGFRDRILSAPRVSVQPKPEWTDADYAAAARKKVDHSESFVDQYRRLGGVVDGAHMLEIGCGAGIDCMLMAVRPVKSVLGLDMSLPLFDPGEHGDRTRRLAREVFALLPGSPDTDTILRERPVRFATMDARRLALPDNSIDLLWSRAAMEHIVPPQPALAEMSRVVRPGGLIYHSIDPFYWLKGCHKGGVVDLPWAHARLAPPEYHRFVAETEGEAKAEKRSRHLGTLNQLTPRQWRDVIDRAPFEVIAWEEERSPFAESILAEYPDVPATTLPGIEPTDLTCSQIKVWMRNGK